MHHVAGLAHVRRQIANRIEDGLGEFVQPFPPQSPTEYLTYVAKIPPEVEIALAVSESVLDSRKLVIRRRRIGEHLLGSWSGGC